MLQFAPTTRARSSRRTGRAEANTTASTRPIHSRQRAAGGRSSSSRSSSPPFFPARAIARARRAGTSRVRSVRGSRRARRAVRTAGAFRARRGRRSGSRRRANPGRAAPAARPWRLSRAVSAPPRPVFAPAAASSAARSQACAAPFAQANRMRVVSAPSLSVVARRPADANSGAASSGSANGHFSFWARTESASQAARSSLSAAPPRPAAGVSARRASSWAPRGRERRQARTGGASLGGVDRRLQRLVAGEVQGVGGDARSRSAIARPIRSRARARPAAGVPPVRDRRRAG